MPTAKQLTNAKTKLKTTTTKSNRSKPLLPTRLTYVLLSIDPKVMRNRQFLKSQREYVRASK